MKALVFADFKALREHADSKSLFKNDHTAYLTMCKTIERLNENATVKNDSGSQEEACVMLFRAVDLYTKLVNLRKDLSKPTHFAHAWWKSRESSPQYQAGWKEATAQVMKVAEKLETLKVHLIAEYEKAAQREADRAAAEAAAPPANNVSPEAPQPMDTREDTAPLSDTAPPAPQPTAPMEMDTLVRPSPPQAGPAPASSGLTDPSGGDTHAHPHAPSPLVSLSPPLGESAYGNDLPPWATQPVSTPPPVSPSKALLPLDVMGSGGEPIEEGARRGYLGCIVIDTSALYNLIEGHRTLLILDVRPSTDFKESHIEKLGGELDLVNIAPNMLQYGCLADRIVENIPARKLDDKRRFQQRASYDSVVIIGPPVDDWNDPPNEYKYLLDAIIQYEPDQKLKQPPRCLDGGYAEFNVTYQALCSARLQSPHKSRPASTTDTTFDLSSLAYGATPTISSFRPAVLTRQAAQAAREKELERQRAAQEARDREERQRQAAAAAAEETARLRREEEARAHAAREAAMAAEKRRVEEERAAAIAAEAAERQRRADEAARHKAATTEMVRRQLEEQAMAMEAARVAEAERARAAAAAAAANQQWREEQARAEAAARATSEQQDAERRAHEAARAAKERLQEQERAAEEARRLREEEERRADQARQMREDEERKIAAVRAAREEEERQSQAAAHRREAQRAADRAAAAAAASATAAVATVPSVAPPPRRAAPVPPANMDAGRSTNRTPAAVRPTAPKPGHAAATAATAATPTRTLSNPRSQASSSPSLPSAQGASTQRPSRPPVKVDRSLKPNGRLSVAVRNARLQSMDAVAGSVTKGITGLRNLGNTCFMNSIIQCVISIAPLTKYFVQGRYRQEINRDNPLGHKGALAEEFGELVAVMWTQGYRYIAPRFFKSTLGSICPQFAGTKQQDSQEFCSFLLDGLHEDLNRVKNRAYVEAPDTEGVDDHTAADAAWDHHRLRNQSAILDLFQGQFKSTITCQSCGHTSTTFEPFTCLSLPLVGRNAVSIEQCLQAFSRPEMLTGNNQWRCPKCKRDRDARKTIQIWRLPRVLIVHLKRFYFEGPFRSKLDTHVEFPLDNLDMGRHCKGKMPRQSKYSLFAVSNHIGDMSGGHYTAYCKSPFNKQWYKCDDSTITRHTQRVCTRQSYVLFYTSLDFSEHIDLF
eukprot:m.176810 g.176810  ORF g.176810 m.176810 type:complete len:1169 (-) comp14238_c0_seq1:66-3572(-)